MMKRFTIALAMIVLPFAVWADSGQTVSVGGTTVNKTVKEITFSGTDVKLSFTDGTSSSLLTVASTHSQDSIWERTKPSSLRAFLSLMGKRK